MIRTITRYPAGLLLSALAASWFFLMLMYSACPPVISSGMTGEKVVALTVDDGPDPVFSPQIVDILQRYGVKATFFVVGEQVEKYPEILVKEIRAGNEIGNHSYSHPSLNRLPRPVVKEEIKRTNGIIYKYSGKNVYWFRPPFRHYDLRVVREAKAQGLQTVLWTSVVETRWPGEPSAIAQRVVSEAVPGGIVLLHDSRLDRRVTVKTLPLIIEGLQEKGYRFVTLSELLADGRREI